MNLDQKTVLIISPYFIPYNTPDMQRIRMSLPYFKAMGWNAEVVAVSPEFSDLKEDLLLKDTIPADVPIHYVKALPKKHTMRIGLGSIALRSMRHYHTQVSRLLSTGRFNLIYFSTTQYPICVLGAIWKRKFGIPYIIDMQDPWHTNYYKTKPRAERPRKYWFSYRLNKYLEPMAMKNCDGLISVSQVYLDDLNTRYPNLTKVPQAVITFGYSDLDFEIARKLPAREFKKNKPNQLMYSGVLGPMMHKSLHILFDTFSKIDTFKDFFELNFFGTSYAEKKARKTALPISKMYRLQDNLNEETDRVGNLENIRLLQEADGLLLIGTDEPAYTASKLYPYLQSRKPILAILHSQSSSYKILKALSDAILIELDGDLTNAKTQVEIFLNKISKKILPFVDDTKFERFSAERLSKDQVLIFDAVLKNQYLL